MFEVASSSHQSMCNSDINVRVVANNLVQSETINIGIFLRYNYTNFSADSHNSFVKSLEFVKEEMPGFQEIWIYYF